MQFAAFKLTVSLDACNSCFLYQRRKDLFVVWDAAPGAGESSTKQHQKSAAVYLSFPVISD